MVLCFFSLNVSRYKSVKQHFLKSRLYNISRSSGAARMSRDAREQPQQPHGIVYNTEPSPRGQYFESDDDGIQSIQVVEGPKAPQPSKVRDTQTSSSW